ncbi:MAG: 2-amino-4-hydroxy-6-hydroxymethyldihydropteridine diphosphokinase [Gammaproteobacteria bacterium]
MSLTDNTVFIGIGSNMADPVAQVQSAFVALNAHPELELIRESSLYRSPPMGNLAQADYVNAVAEVSTVTDNAALLKHLQAIELAHGRIRASEKWGPRTLDLDILLRGAVLVESETLTIPHPGLLQRAFVILPLAEIAPKLILPNGLSASAAAKLFADTGVVRVSNE